MALIVEDGTGIAGAESYVSVAASLVYHSNRGNDVWAALATDTIREQCLRKATDYMLQVYRVSWKGYRKLSTQVLDWPRSFVYLEPFVHGNSGLPYPYLVSDIIVPVEVQNACCELALRAITSPLAPDLTRAKEEVKVGPIAVKYDKNSEELPRYPAADRMLSIYLIVAPMNARVMRK